MTANHPDPANRALYVIRRTSASVAVSGWIVTVVTAVIAAFLTTGPLIGRALAAEILASAFSVAATVVTVISALAVHLDDSQWDARCSDLLAIQEVQRRPPVGTPSP